MLDALLQLALFTSKAAIVVLLILFLLAGILTLLSRNKVKLTGKILVKNLNEKYQETKNGMLQIIFSKKELKKYLKDQNQKEKRKKSIKSSAQKNIYVLNFEGDLKASAVTCLREEVTAVLGVVKNTDEVVVRVESAGGMVHAYGLAAAQLVRIREKNIPLTVVIDKVAASGGYLMSCVADKIYAAPFAIIGSIGVIVQLPNFHRWLKDHHIDFEQLTAGNYKRTLTLFGQNTEEGREKLKEEIEQVHSLFKSIIHLYRKNVNIERVSTGEYWLGTHALDMKLIDGIMTSDDYLLSQSQAANLFEISYQQRKSLSNKVTSAMNAFKSNLFW